MPFGGAAADSLDEWSGQFTNDVRTYNQNTFRRAIRGREYTLSAVFKRVKGAFNILTNSARNLEKELDRSMRPPKRSSGYILIPGGNSAVKVAQ
jgi:hypothetical protein